jgi:hypothetical protein
MPWLAAARPREVVVAAQPDEVLLHSVAVLRRLGARITRYDADAGTAEARLRRFRRPALVRLRVEPEGAGATRLRVESDALAWAPVFRRFRGGLLLLERRA